MKHILILITLSLLLTKPAFPSSQNTQTEINQLLTDLGKKNMKFGPIEKFIEKQKDNPEAIKLLINKTARYLHPQKISGARGQAVEILGMTRNKQAIPHLINALKTENKKGWIRLYAIKALANFNTPEATKAIKTTSQKDKNLMVRQAAKEILEKRTRRVY